MPIKKLLKGKDSKEPHRDVEPPKHAGGGHDESNWLVSYADMMTLLCGFFVMLFSMAKMDEPQYEKVKEAVAKQFGGDYKSTTAELAKFVSQVVQEAGVESQTTVKVEGLGVTVAFQSTIFFDTLSAEIKPEGHQVLGRLSREIFERQEKEGKQYQIVVEGHTDSRPILSGQFPSNWELSGARASRVVRFFLDQRFRADHLTAIGYGDTRPEANARLPDGQLDDALLSKNRRVVLRILSPNADSIPLPAGDEVAQASPATAHRSAAASEAPTAVPAQRSPASQAPTGPATLPRAPTTPQGL